MKIIHTDKITNHEMWNWPDEDKQWVYCALDSMLTREIHDTLKPMLAEDANCSLIYNFERALQGPALEMMLRGIKIDGFERHNMIKSLTQENIDIQEHLNACSSVFGVPEINPRSSKQLLKFFYETLGLPEQKVWDAKKHKMRTSTNRPSLEKLADYLIAQPFTHTIFALRDISSQLGVLKTGIRDGRIYTSLNQGKETGRWSSSGSAFGDGRGLQNIMDSLRGIFIPDEEYRMGYSDLEQAESMCVAYLSRDEAYIQAHLSGDVHSFVANLIWPDIKDVKNTIYYRHWTYRDLAKRAAHATNYYATPSTISKHLKIPYPLAEEFQRKYFAAFPGIKKWHLEVAQKLQLTGCLTTALGRKRVFFSRLRDDATLREAIAYEPQSLVAEILSLGMYRAWSRLRHKGFQLLLPVHDAILYQFKVGNENLISQVEEAMTFPIVIKERLMVIPTETLVGYNWRKYDKKNPTINPQGMVKFGTDEAKAQVSPRQGVGLLGRIIS